MRDKSLEAPPKHASSLINPRSDGAVSKKALLEAIILAHRPSAILEIAGSQCLTEEWLAEAFDGPIHVFNGSPIDHPNARQRLSAFENVRIGGGGHVIFEVERSGIADDRVMAIINANGRPEPKLRETIKFVFRRFSNAIIVLNDFHIPDDDPGLRQDCELRSTRNIRILFGLLPDDYQIGFSPPAPSMEGRDGRGLCVIGAPEWLDAVPQLRAGDYHSWLAIQCEHQLAEDHVISGLRADIAAIATERAARNQALLAELVAKERVIQELSAALKATTSRLEHELAGRGAEATAADA